MNRRPVFRWIAYLLFLTAVLVRAMLVGRQGLWGDELFSLAMATGHSLEHPAAIADPAHGDYAELPAAQPAEVYRRYLRHDDPPAGLARVIRAVRLSDTSPPLYYVLLNGWTRLLGTSDASVEWFSILWALTSLPLIWSVGRQVGNERTAATAVALFTLSPVMMYYSLEVRMYSLLVFLTLCLMWLSLRLRASGPRFSFLVLWTITAAAGLLTHYFFAFVLAACFTWLGVHPGKMSRRALVAAALTAGLFVLPWYAKVPEMLGQWRVTGGWLENPLTWKEGLVATVKLPRRLLSSRSLLSPWVGYLTSLVLAFLGLAMLRKGVRPLFTTRRRLLWACLLAAWFGPLVFDLLRGTFTITLVRFALAGLPAAVLLTAVALSRLRPAAHLAILTVLLASWLIGVYELFAATSRAYQPYREIAAMVAASSGRSDIVIVHSIPVGVLGIARYLHADVPIASWVGQLGQRRIPLDVQRFLEGRPRATLVIIHKVGARAIEEEWLRSHATLISEQQVESGRVLSFVPRTGATFQFASDTLTAPAERATAE